MTTWMRARWRAVLVVAIAVLMTTGLIAGGTLAQTPPATPTPSTTTPAKPGDATKPGAAAKTNMLDAFMAKLAAELKIDQATLTNAAKKVSKDLVDEAVTAGRISKEAADKLKQRIDEGHILPPYGPGGPDGRPGPGGPGGFAGRPGPGLAGLKDGVVAVAGYIGIPTDKLTSELRAGKSLTTIATDNGKTREGLIKFLTDEYTARLKQLVTDGKLTQPQADAMLKRFTDHVGQLVDHSFTPGAGPRGNRPGGPNVPAKPSGSA